MTKSIFLFLERSVPMKHLSKKLTSLLLALTMMFSLSSTAFAAENTVETNNEQNSLTPENYEMVSSGYLKVKSDGSISITDKYINYVEDKLSETGTNATVSATDNTITIIEHSSPSTRSAKRASSGVTKIEWLSFNRFKIYLDNNLSTKVAAGAGIGASLSAWIPDPTVTKIVATALGVSAGLIAFNNKGKGVVISGIFTLSPPLATFYWIKSQ